MRKNTNFVLREIYEKVILMPICFNDASNEPIFLNQVAATIGKNAERCTNKETLSESICKIYSLAEKSSEENAVKYFIDQLITMKLIYEF